MQEHSKEAFVSALQTEPYKQIQDRTRRIGIIPTDLLDPDCPKLCPSSVGRARCKEGAQLLHNGKVDRLAVVGGPPIPNEEGGRLSLASIYYDYLCSQLYGWPQLFQQIDWFDGEGLASRDLLTIDRDIFRVKRQIEEETGKDGEVEVFYISSTSLYRRTLGSICYMTYLSSMQFISSHEVEPSRWVQAVHVPFELAITYFDPFCRGWVANYFARGEIERKRQSLRTAVGKPRLFIPE